MRIHRLIIRSFRGVTEADLDFDPDGVTIVEGPNEIGKSSVAEAIDLILTQPDSSRRQAITDVVQVGRDEGPEVVLEMTAGPYRFTYSKRWRTRPETTLVIHEPRREQLAGRDAHDRVAVLLEEVADVPLWRALRIVQGQELAQASFDATPSLARALDAAVGGNAELTGDREDDLWVRIVTERERYWTTSGKPKRERTELAVSVTIAETDVAEIEGRLQELASDAVEIARLDDELTNLGGRLKERRAAAQELEAEWKEVSERRQQVAILDAELHGATSYRDKIAAERTARKVLLDRFDEYQRHLSNLESQRADSQPVRTRAEILATDAEAALSEGAAAFESAETEQAETAADRDLHNDRINLELLTERDDRVTDAQRHLGEAEEALENLQVDDGVLARVEDASVALKAAEAVAGAGATSVHVSGLTDVRFNINGEPVELHQGVTEQRIADQDLEIEMPGVVRITIRPGSESRSIAESLRLAREKFNGQCVNAGIDSIDSARQSAKARREAQARRETALNTIKYDLRDLTPEILSEKVERLRARVTAREQQRNINRPLPVDLQAADSVVLRARQSLANARSTLSRRREAARDATRRLEQLRLGDASLNARIDQTKQAMSTSEQELAEAREARSDDTVEHELGKTETATNAAEERLRAAADELAAADPDSLEFRRTNAHDVVERAESTIAERSDRRRELAIKLELAGEEGLAHSLDEARTRQSHLSREHERVETRAAAAELLHITFERHRDEARKRYVAPFRERIEKLGRIVFGPDLEIELNDDLKIARRTLGGTTLPFGQLSVGAREQLGIISRLACAQIVSREGGAPVIFDDALGWSDPSRLERMGAVIASAQGDCQVIVLTCTPGRYEAVGAATVITLPQ